MTSELLQRIKLAGRAYRLAHPEADPDEARAEAWRRWPDPDHGRVANSLFRALFLTGWALAASEQLATGRTD